MVHWFAWKQVKRNVGRTVKSREQQQKIFVVTFWNFAKTKLFVEQTAAARNDVIAKKLLADCFKTSSGRAEDWTVSSQCHLYCGRFQHLRVKVSLNPLGRRRLLAAVLRRQKPKVSGIGLHLPGVYTPRRVGSQLLVLWVPHFLHAPTQNSKVWRRAFIIAIPKSEKPLASEKPLDPKTYRPISLLCVTFKIFERLIYGPVEPIIDQLLPQEQAGFRHGRSAVDQVTLLRQDIEDSFQAKKKAELCLSTSQQPTRLYGTAVSPASCCNCCLMDTWPTWSWRLLAIAALPLPPATVKGAG